MLRLFTFVLTLILNFQVYAQDFTISGEIDSLISSKLEMNDPGIAVGIVQNGQIIYTKYLGMANLEHMQEVDEHSRFNIASNAKQFTALCILKLEMEGSLKLTDDFRKYLPGYYPEIKEKITIAQLINHQSGIRDYSDLMGLQKDPWWRREGLNNKAVLKLIKNQKELNFLPGTDFIYSNTNYTILTKIVEELSGQSFEEFSRSLFIELGMTKTAFCNDYMTVIPQKALPYTSWDGSQWKQWPMITDLHGDGFLYTTLIDQLKWEQMVQNINPASYIRKSQSRIPDDIEHHYEFGVEFQNLLGYDVLMHEGVTGSYNAQFIRIPNEKTSIVVLSNNGNLWSGGIAREIMELVLERKEGYIANYPTQPDKTEPIPEFNAISGLYLLEEGGTLIRILEKEGSLYRQIEDRDDVKLIPYEGNIFQYENNPDLKIAFHKMDNGEYQFKLFHPEIAPRTAVWIPGLINPDYTSINGSFFNDELDLELIFTYEGKNNYQVKFGERDYNAQLISENYLRMNNYQFTVKRNFAGQAKELLLDYGRLQNVRFKRKGSFEYPQKIHTTDGGYIQVGTTSENYGKGKGDILLTKNNSQGNQEWFKTFGDQSYDRASSIISTQDGGYLIVGSTSSYGAGNYDIWIIKIDSKGNEQWNKVYGDHGNEYGLTALENENGYTLFGKKQLCENEPFDCQYFEWKVITDKKGNLLQEDILSEIQ